MKNILKLKPVKANKKQTPSISTKVISFASGKGGVGKSCAVVNLAVALADLGQKVLILDADLSLANLDILLGIQPKATIEEVINGEATVEEIIIDCPFGVSLIPAASGVSKMASLSLIEHSSIVDQIENSVLEYDYILIDSAAGIGNSVTYFCSAAHQIVCVVNYEPTSIADAYALLKVLSVEYKEKSFKILVNSVNSKEEGEIVFQRLYHTAQAHLNVSLDLLGVVPYDDAIKSSVRNRELVYTTYPSSKAGVAFKSIAEQMHYNRWDLKQNTGGLQFFFRRNLQEQVI